MIDAAVFRRVALFSELEAGRARSPRPAPSSAAKLSGGLADHPGIRAGRPLLRPPPGEVKVFVDSPDGREVVLSHLQTGDFFGEMALLEGDTRSASVTALTDCELAVLARAEFFAVLERDFSLTRKILKTLSARLRKANEVIESMALLDVGGRLARYLIRLADETGKPAVEGYFVVDPADPPGDRQLDRRDAGDRDPDAQAVRGAQAHPHQGLDGLGPADVPAGARENEWRRR